MSALEPGGQLTDEALVTGLSLEDGNALKIIFERYHNRLYRIAAGVLRDRALAKDLVQDVFVDLWNRRHASQIRNLNNYLTRAIKFQVLKQLRDGKLLDEHVRLAEQIRFANQTEEALNGQELQILLEKAVDQLPPRCRQVFVLSRFENLSHKEIASRMGISAKTVEVQIGKALVFLREHLDKAIFFFALSLLLP